MTPSAFLRQVAPAITEGWNGPPRWLDPKPFFCPNVQDNTHQPISQKWNQICEPDQVSTVAACLAEGLVNFQRVARPVLLVLPASVAHDPLVLVSDILSLLPTSLQFRTIFASHVLDKADLVNGTAFGITYPDSPFYHYAIERHDPKRPLIVDPTKPETFQLDGSTHYGSYVRQLLSEQPDLIEAILNEWDESKFSVDEIAAFPGFSKLVNAINSAGSLDDLQELNKQLGSSRSIPICAATRLTEVCQNLVVRLQASASSIELMNALLLGSNWPTSCRRDAARAIVADTKTGLQTFLAALPPRPVDENVRSLIVEAMIPEGTSNWRRLAEYFHSKPEAHGIELSSQLLNQVSINPGQLFKWLRTLEQKKSTRLCNDLREKLRSDLCSGQADSVVSAAFGDDNVKWATETLTALLDSIPPQSSEKLIPTLISQGLRCADGECIELIVKWLHNSGRLRKSPNLPATILKSAANTTFIESVRYLLKDYQAPTSVSRSPTSSNSYRETAFVNLQNSPSKVSKSTPVDPWPGFWRKPRTAICLLIFSLGLYIAAYTLDPTNRQLVTADFHSPLLCVFATTAICVSVLLRCVRMGSTPEKLTPFQKRFPKQVIVPAIVVSFVAIAIITNHFLPMIFPVFLKDFLRFLAAVN